MEVTAKNKKKGGGDVWRIGEKSGADAFIVRACA
jgi:phage FluMu gp28-like protein